MSLKPTSTGSGGNPPPVVPNNSGGGIENETQKAAFKVIQMQEDAFFDAHKGAFVIETDESKSSDSTSITSAAMGNCITIFALEYEVDKVVRIAALHIKPPMDQQDVQDYFLETPALLSDPLLDEDSSADNTRFCLVGGNKESTKSGALLDNIKAAIETQCPGADVEDRTSDTLERDGNMYVAANLQMDRTLSYCLHKVDEVEEEVPEKKVDDKFILKFD